MAQVSLRSRIMRQKALSLIDQLWALYPDLELVFNYLPKDEVLSCRNLSHSDRGACYVCEGCMTEAKAIEVTVRVGRANNGELLKQLEQSLGLRQFRLEKAGWQMSDRVS